MPPLLPELLNHPVVCMVTEQDGDYWPAIISGVVTLLGAFGGAGFGAWFGAKESRKASYQSSRDLLRQEKIEEALRLLYDIKLMSDKHLRDLSYALNEGKSPAQIKSVVDLGVHNKLERLFKQLRILLILHAANQRLYLDRMKSQIKDVKNINDKVSKASRSQDIDGLYRHNVAGSLRGKFSRANKELWDELYEIASTG